MDHPAVTDEVVIKAIVAKGPSSVEEGIGASMKRALEAVADDIIAAMREKAPATHER